MRFPLHWLPVALLIVTLGSWIVTYLVAVNNHDVSDGWPYISDTGTKPPESCIFGQFLNISAAVAIIVVILKYMHVEVILERTMTSDAKCKNAASIILLNKLALVLGLLSSLGMSMVANFQVTNVVIVHTIGALMAFVLGAAYGWCITSITIVMFVNKRRQRINCSNNFVWRNFLLILVRLLLTMASTTALVLFIVFDKISRGFHGDPAHWDRNWPGWEQHTISTTAEWASCSALFVFISTFAFDFQAHRVKRPRMHRSSERGGGRSGESASSNGNISDKSCENTSAPALTVNDNQHVNFSVAESRI